jgi:hypothetical protein
MVADATPTLSLMSDNPLNDAPLAEVRAWADEVAGLINQERDFTGPPSAETGRRASTGAMLADAYALYRSLLALIDSGEVAGVGVLTRTLYECFLTAVIISHGDDDDWARLIADMNFRLRKLAKAHKAKPLPDVRTGSERETWREEWKVWHRAVRVHEIRPHYKAKNLFNTVYASESFGSAHGGLGRISQHLALDEVTGHIGIEHYPIPEQITCNRLGLATIFVSEVAALAMEVSGYDPAEIRALAKRYHPIEDLGDVRT